MPFANPASKLPFLANFFAETAMCSLTVLLYDLLAHLVSPRISSKTENLPLRKHRWYTSHPKIEI